MSVGEDDFDKAFVGFGDAKNDDADKKNDPVPNDDTKNEDKKDDNVKTDEPKADDKVENQDDKKDDNNGDAANNDVPPAEEKKTDVPEVVPLTKNDIESVVSNLLSTERDSAKQLESVTNDVIEAYYPDGLTNILVDESTGKKLLSPADVVEASGGTMTIEEANQWMLNEQFKLNSQVANIKEQARKIAETTISFKRDAVAAVQKYEPLFKARPELQEKVYKRLMEQVEIDSKKGVILKAPDVMDHYDFYLEPYQQEFERSNGTPATNPVPPQTPPPAAPPAKPGINDRLDETGDGGHTNEIDDPNDFAQQTRKELARGI